MKKGLVYLGTIGPLRSPDLGLQDPRHVPTSPFCLENYFSALLERENLGDYYMVMLGRASLWLV